MPDCEIWIRHFPDNGDVAGQFLVALMPTVDHAIWSFTVPPSWAWALRSPALKSNRPRRLSSLLKVSVRPSVARGTHFRGYFLGATAAGRYREISKPAATSHIVGFVQFFFIHLLLLPGRKRPILL